MEDYDVDEEDEEALIEQRRLQRLAIMQVRIFLILLLCFRQTLKFKSLGSLRIFCGEKFHLSRMH